MRKRVVGFMPAQSVGVLRLRQHKEEVKGSPRVGGGGAGAN